MKNIRKKQVTSHKQKGYIYAGANVEHLHQKLNYFECAHSLSQCNMHAYSPFIQVTNMGYPGSSWGQPFRDHGPANPSTPRSKFNIAAVRSRSVCYQTGCCKSHLWSHCGQGADSLEDSNPSEACSHICNSRLPSALQRLLVGAVARCTFRTSRESTLNQTNLYIPFISHRSWI